MASLRKTLGIAAAIAAVTHVATLFVTKSVSWWEMKSVVLQLAPGSGIDELPANRLVRGTFGQAITTSFLRASPEVLYSMCLVEPGADKVRLSVPLGPGATMVTGHLPNGSKLFHTNEMEAKGGRIVHDFTADVRDGTLKTDEVLVMIRLTLGPGGPAAVRAAQTGQICQTIK